MYIVVEREAGDRIVVCGRDRRIVRTFIAVRNSTVGSPRTKCPYGTVFIDLTRSGVVGYTMPDNSSQLGRCCGARCLSTPSATLSVVAERVSTCRSSFSMPGKPLSFNRKKECAGARLPPVESSTSSCTPTHLPPPRRMLTAHTITPTSSDLGRLSR